MAGNSAAAVWQSAFGELGAPGSTRTAQLPLKTVAPAGGEPTTSWSKFHVVAVNRSLLVSAAVPLRLCAGPQFESAIALARSPPAKRTTKRRRSRDGDEA